VLTVVVFEDGPPQADASAATPSSLVVRWTIGRALLEKVAGL